MENMEKDTKLEHEHEHEHEGDDNTIVLFDEDDNEIVMQILSSRQSPNSDATYVLVAEEGEDEAEVMHFKLIDDGDDTIFELVDDEHEDFDMVFDLFKEDYKVLGIELEEEI